MPERWDQMQRFVISISNQTQCTAVSELIEKWKPSPQISQEQTGCLIIRPAIDITFTQIEADIFQTYLLFTVSRDAHRRKSCFGQQIRFEALKAYQREILCIL